MLTQQSGRATAAEVQAAIIDKSTAHAVLGADPKSDQLTLKSAEVLTIRIHGYANLSGDYRVNADETVSIPVFGRISVKDKVASDLEQDLSRRISMITGTDGYATVEVARYQPILVTGAVTKAGTYPWSHGMRIIHAEALSGGALSGAPRTPSEEVPGMSARAQADRSVNDLKHSLAVLARLKAERAATTTIEIPKELPWLVGSAEAQEIMRIQSVVLEKSLAASMAQTSALESAIAVAQEELAALEKRATLLDVQLSQRKARNQDLAALQSKGHLTRERFLDNVDRVSDLEQRRDSTTVSIARVKSSIVNYRQDLIRLRYVRQADIEKEILALEREIQKNEIDVQSSRQAVKVLAYRANEIDPAKSEIRFEYTIIRQQGSEVVNLQGQQMSELRPADIVVVKVAR